MRVSLKTRYRLNLVIAMLLPLVVVGHFLVFLVTAAIVERYQNEQTDILISLQQNGIDRRLETMEQILLEYRDDPRLPNLLRDQVNARGVISEWDAVINILGWKSLIYMADDQGWIVGAHGIPQGTSFDPRKTVWYQAGKEEPRISWNGPYQSEKNAEVIFTASIGIYDGNGRFCGVLGVDSSLNEIFYSFKHEALKRDAKILALTGNNRVINFNRRQSEPIEYRGLYDWETLRDSPTAGRKSFSTAMSTTPSLSKFRSSIRHWCPWCRRRF